MSFEKQAYARTPEQIAVCVSGIRESLNDSQKLGHFLVDYVFIKSGGLKSYLMFETALQLLTAARSNADLTALNLRILIESDDFNVISLLSDQEMTLCKAAIEQILDKKAAKAEFENFAELLHLSHEISTLVETLRYAAIVGDEGMSINLFDFVNRDPEESLKSLPFGQRFLILTWEMRLKELYESWLADLRKIAAPED